MGCLMDFVICFFFVSSRRRHTRCALVTGVQTCALPIYRLATAVLEVKGLHWASEKAVVEGTLGRLEGVRSVEANPVAQTATVSYDPSATNIGELRRWVEECGYHCAGQSVPRDRKSVCRERVCQYV